MHWIYNFKLCQDTKVGRYLEAVNRRTDSTMAKRKKEKRTNYGVQHITHQTIFVLPKIILFSTTKKKKCMGNFEQLS